MTSSKQSALPEELHLVLVAYGERYLESLFSICIPNLLSRIEEIPQALRKNTILKVITSNADVSRIHGGLQQHLSKSEISFQAISLVRGDEAGPYGGMNGAHRLALQKAWEKNAALIFLFPDSVFCKGAFQSIFEIAEQGYRCIIGPSTRVCSEPVLPILKEKISQQTQKRLDPTAREGASLVLQHLHPMCKNLLWENWNGCGYAEYPFAVYRKIDDTCLAAKTLLGQVIYAWPKNKAVEYRGTIEMEFIRRAFPDYSDIYAVTDSDQFLTFDYSPSDKKGARAEGSLRYVQLLNAVNNQELHTDYHLRFALATSVIHSEDITADQTKKIRVFENKIHPILILALALRWIRATTIKLWNILIILALAPFAWISALINRLSCGKICQNLSPRSK